jgi:hypothetical protein
MTIVQINTEDQLYGAIYKTIGKSRCKKIRVMENGESYEDYSISHTLPPVKAIANFSISIENECIIIKKKAKGSTRHVFFKVGSVVDIVYMDKKVPYIKVNILSEVRYTDGTHRYKK